MSPDERISSGEISAEHLEMQPLLPPPEPAQEVEVNPLTMMFGEYDFKKFFLLLLATGIFAAAMYILELAAVATEKQIYYQIIAIAMIVLSAMIWVYAFVTKMTFGPWSYFRRRLRSTEMQAELASQDIESQHPISPCNHDIELSSSSTGLQPESSNAIADEQRLIELSGDEICTVTTEGEVSSALSKLPPRCAGDAEAVEKSSESDDSNVEASSQPGQKIDPEPDVPSSGELRRRKLENSGELTLVSSSSSEDCKLTSSSDEENVKKV